MRVVGYTRVSSLDQVEGISLDAQRAKIEAYCELHGLELEDILTDEGISAKNTTHRPAAQKVINMIHQKSVDGLVTYKLDSFCCGKAQIRFG